MTKRSDILPYNDPLAELARSVSHDCTYGIQDIIVVCSDDVDRYLLLASLVQQAHSCGRTCYEIRAHTMQFQRAKAYVIKADRDLLPDHWYNAKVIRVGEDKRE